MLEVLDWLRRLYTCHLQDFCDAQANHFVRYAPEQIEYAKNRYVNETNRLYQVRKMPTFGGPSSGTIYACPALL